MIKFFTDNLLWTEGLQIAIVLGALLLLALVVYKPLIYPVIIFIVLSLMFFRNPHRVCLERIKDSNVLVCPADGKVVDISYLDPKQTGYAQKVAIFLSPFDVHVNWTPDAGTVEEIIYTPGEFKIAFLPKSSELNERNDVIIKDVKGRKIRVRQIAGTIARTICCWVNKGAKVNAGQKYGMIRFGSRVEVFLPAAVHLNVGLGQRVYGGQTVLGRWK